MCMGYKKHVIGFAAVEFTINLFPIFVLTHFKELQSEKVEFEFKCKWAWRESAREEWERLDKIKSAYGWWRCCLWAVIICIWFGISVGGRCCCSSWSTKSWCRIIIESSHSWWNCNSKTKVTFRTILDQVIIDRIFNFDCNLEVNKELALGPGNGNYLDSMVKHSLGMVRPEAAILKDAKTK